MNRLKYGLAAFPLIALFGACTTPSDYGLFASPFNRQIINSPGNQGRTWTAPARITMTVSGTWRRLDNDNRSHLRREIATTVQREAAAAKRSSSNGSTSGGRQSPPSNNPSSKPSAFPHDPDFAGTSNNQRLRDLTAIRGKVALSIQNSEGVPVVVLATVNTEAISSSGRSVSPGDVQVISDALALNTTNKNLSQAVQQSARGERAVVKQGRDEFNVLPGSSSLNSR